MFSLTALFWPTFQICIEYKLWVLVTSLTSATIGYLALEALFYGGGERARRLRAKEDAATATATQDKVALLEAQEK